MKRLAQSLSFAALAAGAVMMLAAPRARADSISAAITVDTSLLNPSGNTFELFFQLTDGSQTGDGNNTVTLNTFSFGTGGSAGAIDFVNSSGTFSGTLGSGLSLTDNALPDSQVAAIFTPGSQLSFQLVDTFSSVDSPTPDEFGFSIIENGAPLPTGDTSYGNFLDIAFDSSTPQLQPFADPADGIAAPAYNDLQYGSSTVPEPSTLVLALSGLLLVVHFGLRRRRALAREPF